LKLACSLEKHNVKQWTAAKLDQKTSVYRQCEYNCVPF